MAMPCPCIFCRGCILDKLEENDYDNFRKRAYVSKLEKFLYLPDAWKATSGLPP